MKSIKPFRRGLLWGMMLAKYGKPTCDICKIGIRFDTGLNCYNRATIDHIIPKSKGGTNAINNLRYVCRYCNAVKGDSLDKETINVQTQRNDDTEEQRSVEVQSDGRATQNG